MGAPHPGGAHHRHLRDHLLAHSLRGLLAGCLRSASAAVLRCHGLVLALFLPGGLGGADRVDPLVPRTHPLPGASAGARIHLRRRHHQHAACPGRAGALPEPPLPHAPGRDHQHRRVADPAGGHQPHLLRHRGLGGISGRDAGGFLRVAGAARAGLDYRRRHRPPPARRAGAAGGRQRAAVDVPGRSGCARPLRSSSSRVPCFSSRSWFTPGR